MKDYTKDPRFLPRPAEFDRVEYLKQIVADNRYNPGMVRAACLSGTTKKDCDRIFRVMRTDWERWCRQEVAEGRPFPPEIAWNSIADEIYERHPEEVEPDDVVFFLHTLKAQGKLDQISPERQALMLEVAQKHSPKQHLSTEQHRLENLVGEDKREQCEEKCAACATLHHVGEMFVFFGKSLILTWEEVMKDETYEAFLPFLQHVEKVSPDNIRKNIKSVLKSKGLTTKGEKIGA